MLIRTGDTVEVTAGNDRGMKSRVIKVDRSTGKALVEGVNRVKKHLRPNPMKGVTGGISDKDMPVHVSNLALFNPATQKADRVSFKVLGDGRKVRVFRSNGEQVDA